MKINEDQILSVNNSLCGHVIAFMKSITLITLEAFSDNQLKENELHNEASLKEGVERIE